MRTTISAQLLAVAAVPLLAASAQAQSLDTVVAATLEQAPELAAARAREAGAQARVDAARAERMPSASIEGQIGAGRIDPQGFFGLTADDVTPRSAQFGVDVPLFTGGRIGAAQRQALAGAEAGRAGVDATALELKVAVVRAYAAAIAARETGAGYAKMVGALEEASRQVRLRYEVGAATSTEVAQADARLAEARAARSAAAGEERQALAMLRALSGVEVVPDARLPDAAVPEVSRAEAVARARSGNPRIRAARQLVDAARGGLAGARAERLPTVGAYAEAASVRDQFFPGYAADSASVGVRARWTLFDGGRNRARQDGAAAALAEREAELRAAEAEIERQTISAYEGLMSAHDTLVAARARSAAAEAALRGTRLEVRAGAAPVLALLDAEREAAAATAEETRAAAMHLIQAELLKALIQP